MPGVWEWEHNHSVRLVLFCCRKGELDLMSQHLLGMYVAAVDGLNGSTCMERHRKSDGTSQPLYFFERSDSCHRTPLDACLLGTVFGEDIKKALRIQCPRRRQGRWRVLLHQPKRGCAVALVIGLRLSKSLVTRISRMSRTGH